MLTGASGDGPNRSNVVAAIYGYAVCLIAVFLVIANSAGFVSNLFRIGNPDIGGIRGGGPVFFRTFGPGPGFGDFPPGPPPEIRIRVPLGAGPEASPGAGAGMRTQRIEEVRGNMVALGRLNAVRGLIVNIVLLVIATLLFRAHWRWLGNTRPA